MEKIGNVKAVIFDLDGVITDTSSLHTHAWRRMADEENIPFDDETADKLRGVSRRKSLETILKDAKDKYNFDKNYTQEEFNELMERKNSYYVQSLSAVTPENTLPGAKELMEFIKSRGYKIAVGSSSKNAETVVKNLKIENELDAMVNGTEITHSKPNPEVFQKTADKLGLAYEQCVVVEDAASGVKSANAGGMVSVGIGPEERFKDNHGRPNLRFDDMQSFNAKKEEIF